MMVRQMGDRSLVYLFNLERRIPAGHVAPDQSGRDRDTG